MRIRHQNPALWSLPLLKHMQEYGIECYGATNSDLLAYADAIARIKCGVTVPIDRPGQHYEILEGPDQVGFLTVSPSHSLATGAGGELHLCIFDPGKGIGEQAFRTFVAEHTEILELESLVLESNPFKARITRLLTRCGFENQDDELWVWRRRSA